MLLCTRWTGVGFCGGWESVAAPSLHGCSITAYIIHVRMKHPYTAAIRPLPHTPTHHLTTIHPQTHTNVKKRTQRTQVTALTSLGTTIPSSLKGEATPLSVAAMVRCNSSRMNYRGTTRICPYVR